MLPAEYLHNADTWYRSPCDRQQMGDKFQSK